MKALILLLTLYASISTAQVHITLVNNTGTRLEDVKLGTFNFGNIDKGNSGNITLALVETYNNIPYYDLSLLYNTERLKTNNPSVGMTYLNREIQGSFVMQIIVQKDSSGKNHLIVTKQSPKGYCPY